MTERHDVVVIGAGNAGLACARRLAAGGHDVLVIEAADRVGGRSMSGRFGRLWYNLGTQYIGGIGTPAEALAKEAGVELSPIYENCIALYAGERLVTAESGVGFLARLPLPLLDKVSLVRTELGLEKERRLGAKLTGSARADRRATLDDMRFADLLKDARPAVRDVYRNLLLMMTGGEPERTSAFLGLLFTAGIGTPHGENHPPSETLLAVTGGTAALPIAVAAQLGARVRTGTPATSVRPGPSGIEIGTLAGVLQARACVVAVPAHDAVRIAPDLPEPVRAALATVEYGPFVSAILHLRCQGRGPWEKLFHVGAVGLRFQAFNNLTYFQPGAHDEAVFLAFAAGDLARNLMATSDEDIAAAAAEDLARIFPQSAGALMGQAVQRWPHGLPFWKPGTDAARRLFRDLPGPIFLAGDYTDYPNIQGAIRSGQRAADAVSASLRN